jgi:multiple sugar transport system substrate-binding protein
LLRFARNDEVPMTVSRPRVRTTVWAVALAGALLAGAGCHREPADVATVRFWAFGREGEEVRALVPEFERLHPRIRVEVQQIPWTAAHEKLLTAFVGRVTPDAAQLGNTWIPELAALGALAPLDARLAGHAAVQRDDYFPGVWDGNVVDGTTWGVPWYVDTRLLFYRTDLVAKTGLPWPPRSWAEWRRVMERIREQGGADRYAILLPIDEWAQPVVFGLQNGAGLLDAAGARGRFRDPRFRRAMGFYLDLYKSGLAPPLDRSGMVNLYQQFAEGYFAMVVTGPWNLGEFASRIPADQQDRWATAPLPPPEADMPYPGASIAGGSSLVVFRRAVHADAAWQWLEFLSAPAQQARFYQLTGDLPARRSAWERTDLAADPKARPFLVQLGNALPVPKVPEWERIATRIADRAEQGVRGGRSLDAVLAGLDADADRILEKRRWMLSRAERRGG